MFKYYLLILILTFQVNIFSQNKDSLYKNTADALKI